VSIHALIMKKLVVASLVAAAVPAFAESQPAPLELRETAAKLTENKRRIGSRSFAGELERDAHGVTACQASIERARERGATKLFDDSFKPFGAAKTGTTWELTLGQAEGVCREAAFYKEVVLKDVAVFAGAHEPQHVQRCQPALDAMLAAGVAPSLSFVLDDRVKTVGDLKAHCALAAKRSTDYMQAGIKGNRLALVLQYGNVYLPGGAPTDNLKKLATAPVLFLWTTSDPDANDDVVHTVRKHLFKGNTLVKSCEKTYRTPRGAKLGASVFK
jgi:hypothetical protein